MTRATPWVGWAINEILSDYNRSSDTHLLKLSLPILDAHDIHLYYKDESTHPTGSLKHRLARSLFLHAICSGWIQQGHPVIEASSGSTAISEAYFCRLLKLPFIAVVPENTAPDKLREIEFLGGQVERVGANESIYDRAEALAWELDGHYMDQFTYAEQATDWRGNNNIAESIFEQMAREPYPIPRYIVTGAGTGGTSATIGRYIRYRTECVGWTELVVADPEDSVFFDYFRTGDRTLTASSQSVVEGIGRPRVERSFIREVIDDIYRVTDEQSLASMRYLERHLGKRVGASTGTNTYVAFKLIAKMLEHQHSGSVVTLLCDAGERYQQTYYNDEWLNAQGIDLNPITRQLEHFEQTGQFDLPVTPKCDC